MDERGERRIVSVLISDVVDSTAIQERLGPERSKFLFDEIAALVAEEIRSFDGTVAQLTGDGVLALFGAPAAHGDDAERAVRAALGIHERLARYAADVADAYGIELAARVAINTGPVVVPGRDAAPDVLYNALGDTVNVAARLQSHAGPGGVAIGPTTARELVGSFALEPLGELELKGKADPVTAFRVVGEARAAVAREGPLVGRATELGAFVAALARLEDGVGSIVSITGEAGIGKSRLVTEAVDRAAGDVRVLTGHASSYATQSPFWPVRDLLRGWLGVGVSEAEGRTRLELKAALAATLDGEAEAVYPFLASLLGLVLDGADAQRLRDLSRDSVQRQAFEAVATLFEALAREHPLCLVFEDLHWADESTLKLLEELLVLADREAATLVLLYRSEREHGSWRLGELARQRFPHRLVELDLRPLAPEESTLLAAGAAGGDLPWEVNDLLANRAGGNPFFLEETVRDLVERGVLQPVNAHWELTIAAGDLTVPLLVQEILQARLDRLEPGTREVASVASVVGRTFGLPLLERLVDGELLGPALSELQRLDLVVEERRRPAPEYRFRHGLVQEVAYSSLTESRRRELHLAAGRALEELHVDAPQEAYELLAHHFTEAGAPEKAVEYRLRAGDAAWALYADRDALEHYRRALGLMEEGDERARDLLLKIGLAHHLDLDFAGADAAWAKAQALERPRAAPRALTERLVTFATAAALPPVAGHSYHYLGCWLATDLFSGLLRLARGLHLVTDAAAELRVSADGLRYRARIRDDALWSDGERLSAHDFVYTWQQIRAAGLPTAHLLDDVAKATAIDDATLEIRLAQPRPYFPFLLALPPLFPWPRHRHESVGDAWFERSTVVTNGPFTIAERDEHQLVLRANPHWQGLRGNVAEVVVRFMGPDERAASWDRGELDLTLLFRGVSPAHAEHTAWLMTQYVGFLTDAAPFDDVRVRRAFALALDRTLAADERIGQGEPATTGGFVPPAMPGHSHRIGLDFDPARAGTLLAEAGFPGGRGLPPITMATSFPGLLVEKLVAAQWREHLHAEVAVVPMGVTQDPREVDPRPSCWVNGWTADFPDPAGFLAPALQGVPFHHHDPVALELLARFNAARRRDERLELVGAIERRWLSEQVALVPLYYSSQAWLRRPWVHEFTTTPLLPGHLSDIVIRR